MLHLSRDLFPLRVAGCEPVEAGHLLLQLIDLRGGRRALSRRRQRGRPRDPLPSRRAPARRRCAAGCAAAARAGSSAGSARPRRTAPGWRPGAAAHEVLDVLPDQVEGILRGRGHSASICRAPPQASCGGRPGGCVTTCGGSDTRRRAAACWGGAVAQGHGRGRGEGPAAAVSWAGRVARAAGRRRRCNVARAAQRVLQACTRAQPALDWSGRPGRGPGQGARSAPAVSRSAGIAAPR